VLVAQPLDAAAFAPFGHVAEVGAAGFRLINAGKCRRFTDLLPFDVADGRAGLSLFGTATEQAARSELHRAAAFKAVPLGIQHVLAMFVSNVTPAIIVAGAAGFGFGSNSPDFPELTLPDPDVDAVRRYRDAAADHRHRPGRGAAAHRAGHQLRLHSDHDPAGRGSRASPARRLFGGVMIGGVFHAASALDRAHPLRPAAAGHRAGRHDDRPGAGQGRRPVRRRRRAAMGKPEYGSLRTGRRRWW
jgi:hypothetical protein